MSLPIEWQVFVAGINATSRMNRYIEAIECEGHAGGQSDSARLTFNAAGGMLMLPKKNSPVDIRIAGRLRFRGFTDAPEVVLARGGGTQLEIACAARDKTGDLKRRIHAHKDDCTLKDFLEAMAEKAGLSGIRIDENLGGFHRPYWSTRGRTFLRLGQMLADEYGATFKIRGDKAVFAARGGNSAPGGGALPTIRCWRGTPLHPGNIVECRIRPYEGQYRYAKARTRYYDRDKAKWIYRDVEIGAQGKAGAVDVTGEDRPDAASAERAAKGRKAESEREGGSGSITILYDPDVEVEGLAEVAGVYDGVDGTYRIESWRERITRSAQAEQELELKQPSAEDVKAKDEA